MPISRSVNKDILTFFNKVENKRTDYINKLVVSSYVLIHNLKIGNGNLLCPYIIPQEEKVLQELVQIIKKSSSEYGIEELVELFEYVISPADKEVNGAVYTPAYIREFIVARILKRYKKQDWTKMLFADLSCGCGGFFYTLIKLIKLSRPNLAIRVFVRECVLGVDIKEFSIERTKLLLALYALQEGVDLADGDFNLYCQNSLGGQFTKAPIVAKHGGIDVVMGNPPYVASSKLTDENKKLLLEWEVSKTGKADLYLPFFQLGIDHLRPNGTLGYITVNTFYRSLNGGAFRSYLSRNGYDLTVVDFGSEQLFRGCSTYTCICFVTRNVTEQIHYLESNSSGLSSMDEDGFESIDYGSLDDKKGWILKDRHTSGRIRAIESVGTPLGEVVDIRNGFATLRNEIYLIHPAQKDRHFFYFEKDGTEYQVERALCRKAIKANLIREEADIEKLKEYIIYPYRDVDGVVTVIEDDVLERNYPHALRYLVNNRAELAKRDKGKKKYPKWYAYGRTQALNLVGERLLFPHICDRPCFIYTGERNLLFYDGYAIFAHSHRQLEIIRRVISSDIFWYYITRTSKPYSGGFFSLEKRYIKFFGIPNFTEEQEDELLSLNNQEAVNGWLRSFYPFI